MSEFLLICVFTFLVAQGEFGNSAHYFSAHCCDEFDTKSVTYTSKESVLAIKTLVIVEGEAKCKGIGVCSLSSWVIRLVFEPLC